MGLFSETQEEAIRETKEEYEQHYSKSLGIYSETYEEEIARKVKEGIQQHPREHIVVRIDDYVLESINTEDAKAYFTKNLIKTLAESIEKYLTVNEYPGEFGYKMTTEILIYNRHSKD